MEEENLIHQMETTNGIEVLNKEIEMLLTQSLTNHLNLDQTFLINRSDIIFSLEQRSLQSITHEQLTLEHIKWSVPMDRNETIFIRTQLEPLAPFGHLQARTNASRSLSFSFVNKQGSEVINQSDLTSMEFFIPRDPYQISSPMILQDVIDSHRTFDWKSIPIREYQPNENLSVSIHFHIAPVNRTDLGYLFLYHFDQDRQMISLDQAKNWTLFCPSSKVTFHHQEDVSLSIVDLNDEKFYVYFINNEETFSHQSLVFGFRQLTTEEREESCRTNDSVIPAMKNKQATFTSNYRLRIFTSACFYLDEKNQWRSDGLVVRLLFSLPSLSLSLHRTFDHHLV